jgi:hypothetical protein
MTKERVNLGFSDPLGEFNPADWQAELHKPPSRLPPEATRRAAEATGFHSRETGPQASSGSTATDRAGEPPVRRRRTGRNAQFNLKARPDTIAAFCEVADQQGWGLGETLEYAVQLLQEKYKGT